jgi:hypothetical protein
VPGRSTRSLAITQMRTKLIAMAVLMTGGCSVAAKPDSPDILGKWTWADPRTGCVETYEYQPRGVLLVKSAEERTENAYTFEPGSNGSFKLSVRVVKDYGGIDCQGSLADSVGQENTVYLFFDDGGATYQACPTPKLGQCFGPVTRAIR